MKTNILDLIDFEKVDSILEGFNKITGFAAAILDLEGKVLSKSDWRQICTDFHRVNPETSIKCSISDTELAGKLPKGEKFHFYKCLNGLIDVSVPIVINGKHVANLFSGQFLFEEPDRQFFKRQAKKYGFDEKKYLEALEKIPLVSEEKVKIVMDFLLNITQIISDVTEKKLADEEILFQANLLNAVEQAVIVTNKDGIINFWNPYAEKLYGWFAKQVTGRNITEITVPQLSQNQASEIMAQLGAGKSWAGEFQVQKRDGTVFPAFVTNTPIVNSRGELTAIIGISKDITEPKRIENSLIESRIFNETLLNTSPNLIYIYDLVENRNVYSNGGIRKILGYSVEEVSEMGNEIISSLMHEEDLKIYLNKIIPRYQTAKDGELIEYEYRMKHKHGEWFWLRSKESIFKRNPDNSPKQIFGITSDVTSSKEVQKKLLEEKNKAQQYLDIAEVILLSIDSKGLVQLINPKGCEVLGFSEDELIGQHWYDNFIPERKRKTVKEVAKKIFSGEIESAKYYENEVLTKSGKEKIIAWNNSVLKDEKGNIIGTLSSGEDITERKHSEEKLKESEKKHRLISEKITDVIWLMDLNGNSTYVSPSIEKFSGFTVEAYLNQTIQTRFEEKSAKYAQKLFREELNKYSNASNQLRKNYYKKTELEYLCKNGKTKWGELIITPYFNEDNKLVGIHGVTRDVTDRKEAEKALIESEEKFRTFSQISPVGIFVTDVEGKPIYFNDKLIEVTGMSIEEGKGTAWVESIHPDDKERVLKEWNKSTISISKFDLTYRFKNKQAKITWVIGRAVPMKDTNGELIGFVGSIVDVTSLKQVEDELEKHRDHLEELVNDRTKDLEMKILEIERMNKLFIGRELRMKELKGIIKDLEEKLKMT